MMRTIMHSLVWLSFEHLCLICCCLFVVCLFVCCVAVCVKLDLHLQISRSHHSFLFCVHAIVGGVFFLFEHIVILKSFGLRYFSCVTQHVYIVLLHLSLCELVCAMDCQMRKYLCGNEILPRVTAGDQIGEPDAFSFMYLHHDTQGVVEVDDFPFAWVH